MAEESVKNKTIDGVTWETINTVLKFAVSFIVSIILARLLTPDDYGLIGIITIFIVIADCITTSGFFSSLIQKKDADADDYNTMFISNMVSSVCMYTVLYFCSPAISRFFNRPELIDLIRVQSLSLIISAFALVQRARFFKILDFKTPAKITVIASVISGVLGIFLAFFGYGVWSLVYSSLVSTLLITVLSCAYSRWIPRLKFSISSFKNLFGYGWKILVAELLDNIWMQLYQIVVGKFYSPATLGQYSRGKSFVDLFSTNIYNITRKVTFSALCQIQDDKERQRIAFRKMIKVLFFVTSICVFGVAAIGKSMIMVLIGEKWLPSVAFLQILCFGSLLYPINATNMNLLKSQGRSDLFLVLSVIKKFLDIGPILLGIFVDIYWMVWGSVVTNWIGFFLYAHFAGKKISYSARQQFVDLLPALCFAIAMAAPVWFMSFLNINSFVLFPTQLLVAFGIVLSLGESTRFEDYCEVKDIVFSTIKSFTNKIMHHEKESN